ncbi:MAG: ATP-dependent helicase DeaD [Actinomycetota bacterium]|nr:ATP-dependent helicase DeaD [Actinomycetota bacterium]
MDATETVNEFAQLGLRTELAESLTQLGYEAPTPIQRSAIPQMLAGKDLLCQAATGTGKTAAFALPLLNQRAEWERGKKPTALVLAPTRELCMQVAEAVHRYGRPFGMRTLPVYGGQPIGRQISALKRGVDIVVATPGRALDLLQRGTLSLSEVQTVVLDEADEMLDMGFAEDIEAILEQAPSERQTVMFSATMPKRILRIAKAHLRDPLRIEIPREVQDEGEGPKIQQTAYIVSRAHKVAALGRILDVEAPTAALVFCRTRDEVDQLAETLNGRGYRAEGLHGGMDQAQRDRVMGRLRSGNAELLVATDVAARGLDIDHLTHVINFDVPAAPESYVHRIGRVGRGDRRGVAITIAEPREQRLLRTIERSIRQRIDIAKVPTSAELRERRLTATRNNLARICLDEDLDDYRGLLGSLTVDFNIDQVTLAAIKMAHLATVGEAGEADIPQVEFSSSERHGDRGGNRGKSSTRGGRAGQKIRPGSSRGKMQRLFISAGAEAGIRPQDVVGAIANETTLAGSDVGVIDISARFSTVEVPADSAKEVIAALSATRIKGKKVKARRDRH